MPDGFDQLPPIFQVVSTMAVVIIGGTIAFFQFSKKWLDKITPEKMKEKQPTTDAVVISAAFADAKPMRELVEAVRLQVEGNERFTKSIERNTSEHRRQTESSDELLQVGRDILHELREMRHERRSL